MLLLKIKTKKSSCLLRKPKNQFLEPTLSLNKIKNIALYNFHPLRSVQPTIKRNYDLTEIDLTSVTKGIYVILITTNIGDKFYL